MAKVIVSLKDTATQVFGTPFLVNAPAQAVRSLRDEVNSKDSTTDIRRHPDDFELFVVAHFDELTGTVVPVGPELVCRAKDLLDAAQAA
jgi:hypothetical protein